MFYDKLCNALNTYRQEAHPEPDMLYQELKKVIIENFPPKAQNTQEFIERPVIIKQQANAWKLFVESELGSEVIWVGEDLYRETIKRCCFKDEGAANRMFNHLGW